MNGGIGDSRLTGFICKAVLFTIAEGNAIGCKSTKTKQAARFRAQSRNPEDHRDANSAVI